MENLVVLPAPVRTEAASHLIRLAGQQLALDRGQITVLSWADSAALEQDITMACTATNVIIRYAGGALMEDLTLEDNLMLESALSDGTAPRHLFPELEALFEKAGCPFEGSDWATTFPDEANSTQRMQAIVGRALLADPDILLIDLDQWDDALLAPQDFSRSFARQFPWRTLGWASCDISRSSELRQMLEGPAT